MRLDRRTLVDSLERMGRAPVPPASPDFAVRTEERLRSLPPVTLVDDEIAPAPARPRRPVPWVPALVAAAVIGLLALAPRAQRPDVAVITDRSSTTTTTFTTTTTAPAPTTTTAPTIPDSVSPPAKQPVVTTTPKVRPAPTTTVATRPEPTTTTVPVEPTIPHVTTTTPPPITKLELRCTAGFREGVPLVNCTWTAAGDVPVAGWRVYRAVGADAKRTVWTASEPATTSYTDRDVVVGTMYRYAVEGVDTGGRTVAKTAIVEVACCPA